MDKERFDQVKRLFEAALQRDPAERSVYLDALTDIDPELRNEVEALLASHGEDRFLEITPPDSDSIAERTAEKSTGIRPPGHQTEIPNRKR